MKRKQETKYLESRTYIRVYLGRQSLDCGPLCERIDSRNTRIQAQDTLRHEDQGQVQHV